MTHAEIFDALDDNRRAFNGLRTLIGAQRENAYVCPEGLYFLLSALIDKQEILLSQLKPIL